MASPGTERFMQALQRAEEQRAVDELVGLFAADAELRRLSSERAEHGVDGARRFWHDYLHAFERVRSTFPHIVEAGPSVALEWVSEGSLPDGRPIRCLGVSLLELEGEQVKRFRTYYDTAAFVGPMAAR